jgi:hypothetical protein
MRKLAHIETIKDIQPIEGADMIVKATILGWDVVVKKDEFNIGDKCIYIEIDSLMKDIPCFEFLRTRNFKIKTAKLKGVVSYGIIFPLYLLKEEGVLEEGWIYNEEKNRIESILMNVDLVEGEDLTSIMGIVKYDLEEGESLQSAQNFCLNPKKSKFMNMVAYWKWKIRMFMKRFDNKSRGGEFPKKYGVKKSDEERIQSLGERTKESFIGKSFTILTKMDGSSMTLIKYNKEFVVCSRNLAIGENNDDRFWKAVHRYDLKNRMKMLGRNLAIQMELVGEKIQDNRYNIKGNEVRLFIAYDIDKKKYLSSKEMIDIANELGIPHVVVVDDNFIYSEDTTTEELVALATRKAVENPLVNEEGLVFVMNDSEQRFSFKVINPDYLLEKEAKENRGKKDKEKRKAKEEFNANKNNIDDTKKEEL